MYNSTFPAKTPPHTPAASQASESATKDTLEREGGQYWGQMQWGIGHGIQLRMSQSGEREVIMDQSEGRTGGAGVFVHVDDDGGAFAFPGALKEKGKVRKVKESEGKRGKSKEK